MGALQPLQRLGHPVQVGDIGPVRHLEGIGAAEGRGEVGEAEHGAGDAGAVGFVGFVAQDDTVGGLGRHQMVAKAQIDHHGGLGQEKAPVKADAAEFPAGAGGGDLHGHSPPGHGKQGPPFEKEGGENGQLCQVAYGAQLVRGEAQVGADGGVAGAVADVVGAVVPAGPQESLIGAGKVVGVEPPKQALTGQHGPASFLK